MTPDTATDGPAEPQFLPRRRRTRRSLGFFRDGLALLGSLALQAGETASHPWDTFADTWVATDAPGRALPTHAEVGPPRADRTLGIFYFLWHGAHVQGGPYDVTKILARDPHAMSKPDSPLWGPLHAPHHWGESLFGCYLTQDEGVLRKHAQMLADAGVDVVIFDVTNQLTYRDDYLALLRVWSRVRAAGNRTPQVAFLTPFWDPAKVVRELWRDLYAPGLFPDLWFRWEGKPLILADPALILDRGGNDQQNTPVELRPGHTLGQSFTTTAALERVGGRFPTWRATGSAMTLTLYRDSPGDERLGSERFENVRDNEWRMLRFDPPLPPGRFHLEMSEPTGQVGWWSHTDDMLAGAKPSPTARPWRATAHCVCSPLTRRRAACASFSPSANRSRTISRDRPAPINGAGLKSFPSRCSPTPPAGANWLVLFLDADTNAQTGWLGYDFRVNASRPRPGRAALERWQNGAWQVAGSAEFRSAGNQLELALAWSALGLRRPPAVLDFKWTDNCLQAGDWTDFTLNGDAAPNDRFNYRAVFAGR
jgi:hypothetical protein